MKNLIHTISLLFFFSFANAQEYGTLTTKQFDILEYSKKNTDVNNAKNSSLEHVGQIKFTRNDTLYVINHLREVVPCDCEKSKVDTKPVNKSTTAPVDLIVYRAGDQGREYQYYITSQDTALDGKIIASGLDSRMAIYLLDSNGIVPNSLKSNILYYYNFRLSVFFNDYKENY